MGVLLIAGAVSLTLFYRPQPPQPRAIEPNGTPPLFTSPVIDGMKIYKSPLLRFEITYPEELGVKEYGKADTSTIVFEDATGDRGFQVFVVPYEGETVSEKRFKMDVPSGVMQEPIQVLIDGVTATAFWSTNTLFGETREVWFIRGGFLYEITTFKDLDPWLAEIMKSWKFL
ncbi:MAG: hypothetical protein AAB442_03060 [Patescibacteria group bacterium]